MSSSPSMDHISSSSFKSHIFPPLNSEAFEPFRNYSLEDIINFSNEKFDEKCNELNEKECEWEAQKIEFELRINRMEKKNTSLNQQSEIQTSKISQLKRELEDLKSTIHSNKDYQSQLSSNISEKDQKIEALSNELEKAKDANLKIAQLVQERDEKISSLTQHTETLNNRIKDLIQELRDVNDKLITEQSKSIPIEYKYKDAMNEKDSLEKHAQWLQQQLDAKEQELLSSRTAYRQKINGLEIQIHSLLNEKSILENSNTTLKSDIQTSTQKITNLTQKLNDIRHEKESMESIYQEEVTSKERVIQLLKASIQDLESKLQSQTQKYTLELQRHQQEINEKENSLQEWIEKCSKANKEAIALREELKIKQSELEHAMSPDESIRNILQGGLKSSELCEKLVTVSQELVQVKAQKHNLQVALDDIMRELEVKKPLFKEQKEDYERLTAAYVHQAKKFQQILREKSALEQQVEMLSKKSTEIDSLKNENDALSIQITHLLKECMDYKKRLGVDTVDMSALEEANHGDSSFDTRAFIKEDLITFSDIAQLQETNRSLLREIQSLKYEKEFSSRELTSRLNSSFETQLNNALAELEKLRKERQQSSAQVKDLKQERDVLRSMLAELDTQLRNKDKDKMQDADSSLPSLSVSIKELKDIQSEYIKNRQMIQDELDSERKLRMSSESTNQRLQAQLDDIQTRVEMKDQHVHRITLELNQEKETKTTLIERLLSIQDSLTQLYNRLEEKETQLSNQISNNNRLQLSLKFSNERIEALMQEISSFEKYKKTQEEIASQSRLIQSRLETQYLQEREIVQSLKEREKELIQTNEARVSVLNQNIKDLELQLDSEKERLNSTLQNKGDELAHLKEERGKLLLEKETLTKRVDELSQKLKESESRLTTLINNCTSINDSEEQDPSENSAVANNNLRVTLSAYKQDLEVKDEMIHQLKISIDEANQLCKEKEEQLLQLSELYETFKSQMNSRVESLELEREKLIKQSHELENSLSKTNNELLEAREMQQSQKEELQRSLEYSTNELMLSSTEERISILKKDLEEEHKQYTILKKKYESEIIEHGATMKKLIELENKLQEYRENPNITQNFEKDHENLKLELQTLKDANDALQKSKDELQHRINSETDQKNALHLELDKLLADFKNLLNHKPLLEEESESNKRVFNLHELVRHLRRENEIFQSQAISEKKKYQRLAFKVQSLERTLEEKEKEIQEVQSKVLPQTEEQYTDRMELIKNLSLYKESNITLRNERDQLENKNKEYSTAMESLESNVSQLEKKIEQLENMIKLKEKELEHANATIEKWKIRVDAMQQKDSVIHPDQYEALKVANQQLESNSTQLKQQVSEYEDQLSSLKLKVESNKRLSAQYKQENEKLKSEIEKFNTEVDKRKLEAEELKKENEEQDALISKQKNSLKILRDKFESVKAKRDQLQEEKDTQDALITRQKNSLKEMYEKYKSLEAKKKALQNENKQLSARIEELEKAVHPEDFISENGELSSHEGHEDAVAEILSEQTPQEDKSEKLTLKRKSTFDNENEERPPKRPKITNDEEETIEQLDETLEEEEVSEMQAEDKNIEEDVEEKEDEDMEEHKSIDIESIKSKDEVEEPERGAREDKDIEGEEIEEEESESVVSDLDFEESTTQPIIITTQNIEEEGRNAKPKNVRQRRIQRPSFGGKHK